MSTAYGIDLGTTYSAIAKLGATGAPEIIEDTELGKDTLASAVFFTEDDSVIVGDTAKELGVTAPERLHQFFKRWIGRSTDPNRERYIVDGKEYDPIELSAIVLGRIITYTKYNGEEVKDVVITCPTYFDYAQKDATKQACIAAGLNVMAVINEPTAAVINYCQNRFDKDQNVLVYDLGGGTFDVTLMRMTQDGSGGSVDVLGTDGDVFLGGCDWDNELYLLLLVKFEDEYGTSADEMPEDFKALIRSQVEDLKIKLTNREKVKAKIPYDGENVILEVTREEFESATAGYVEQTIGWLNAVLQKANMTDDDVDIVLMVGGSTKMPMIRGMLSERFGEKAIFDEPDKSVAKGAAIIADMMIKRHTSKQEELTTKQMLNKLQEQIQQGVAHFVYNPKTERIGITYSNDAGEEELLSIFEELRMRKDMLRNERKQINELICDSAGLLNENKRIIQLRTSLSDMEKNRKCIEELIKYRLQENLAGLFLHFHSMEELDKRLGEFISNRKRIEDIIEALKVGAEDFTAKDLEDIYMSRLENEINKKLNALFDSTELDNR